MERNFERKIILRFDGVVAEGNLEVVAEKEEELDKFIKELKKGREHEFFPVAKDDVLLIHP